jgi:hypothetical protein
MSLSIKMVQNAYVVESIEEAAEEFHKSFGLGPFMVVRDFKLANHKYRGTKTDDVIVDAAVTQSGDLQIELVKVKSNVPNAISDMHSGKGTVLHHVAHICDDYEKTRDDLVKAGYPIASEFTVGQGSEICFIDTRAAFNHMLELYSDSKFEKELYRIVRETTEKWDGRNLFIEW